LLSRETCIHAYGADCLEEYGKILLVGNSIDHMTLEEFECSPVSRQKDGDDRQVKSAPPRKKTEENSVRGYVVGELEKRKKENEPASRQSNSLFSETSGVMQTVVSRCNDKICPWKNKTRMHIREFTAIFDVTGPCEAHPIIIVEVDPNLGSHIPTWVINFAIKHLAGALLHYFQQRVQAMSAEEKEEKAATETEFRGEEWLSQKNQDFYENWLAPRVKSHYERKGWDLRKVIPCLTAINKM